MVTRERGSREPNPVSTAHWRLPCTPSSVGQARSAVRSFVGHAEPFQAGDVAELLVSELIANAVLHSRVARPIDLWVEAEPGHLHIEVEDGDPSPPVPRPARPDDDRGRGLFIVDRMAERWGWDPLESGGKRVWCDLESARGAG